MEILTLQLLVAILEKLKSLKRRIMTIENDTAKIGTLTLALDNVGTQLDSIQNIIDKLVAGQVTQAQIDALDAAVAAASAAADSDAAKAAAIVAGNTPPVTAHKK